MDNSRNHGSAEWKLVVPPHFWNSAGQGLLDSRVAQCSELEMQNQVLTTGHTASREPGGCSRGWRGSTIPHSLHWGAGLKPEAPRSKALGLSLGLDLFGSIRYGKGMFGKLLGSAGAQKLLSVIKGCWQRV